MNYSRFIIKVLFALLGLWPIILASQEIDNVAESFLSLNVNPEVFIIQNNLDVPTTAGHLQGVQVIEKNDADVLYISGSSLSQSYVLQVDLTDGKTEKVIPLMEDPYRHAGGFQISGDYLAVGIEDNFIKTSSKICLYNLRKDELDKAQPGLILNREGPSKTKTAGATGLIPFGDSYLMVVSNWDSRNWDFYSVDPENSNYVLLDSFSAPANWAGYQSINLIKDEESIYAVGFYKNESKGIADLILVSKTGIFKPIMTKISTKVFNVMNGVDFGTASGLQVDQKGNLHVWGTQRDALEQISINRFSQRAD